MPRESSCIISTTTTKPSSVNNNRLKRDLCKKQILSSMRSKVHSKSGEFSLKTLGTRRLALRESSRHARTNRGNPPLYRVRCLKTRSAAKTIPTGREHTPVRRRTYIVCVSNGSASTVAVYAHVRVSLASHSGHTNNDISSPRFRLPR